MSARSGRLSMTFDFYVIYRLMRRRLAHLPHFENATSIMYGYKSMKQHTESHMENNVSFRVPSLSRSLHLFAACLAQYSSNVLTVWVNTLFSAHNERNLDSICMLFNGTFLYFCLSFIPWFDCRYCCCCCCWPLDLKNQSDVRSSCMIVISYYTHTCKWLYLIPFIWFSGGVYFAFFHWFGQTLMKVWKIIFIGGY